MNNSKTQNLARVATAGLLLLAACSADARPSEGICVGNQSVARVWNEAALDAIRRDFPAPTVHARNLFHLSAAAWDSWAAYDPLVRGLFSQNELEAAPEELEKLRATTISYAAHRLLTHRYALAVGATESLLAFDQVLESLCLPSTDAASEDPAAALGVAIADEIIDGTRADGSLEAANYVDLSYAAVNPPLSVDQPGSGLLDPDRWQPLSLEVQITQNGLEIAGGVQEFIGPSWGTVATFAIEPDPVNGLPIDPGPPPLFASDRAGYVGGAIEVLRLSSLLDPNSSSTIDIGPRTLGDAPLGSDISTGYDTNPFTEAPYEPNMVLEADYGRVIAEYWADGPSSETPPGHWNTIANQVTDRISADGDLRLTGEQRVVSQLEWDVKLGITLNGALHDAAVAAWGSKSHYDSVRPISMIRWLGEEGSLPEQHGLVETITAESSEPGSRHELLSDHVGQLAVFAWRGPPGDVENTIAGTGWILATTWVPYQRPSFVTPSFPGYVSGHSAFSRAAAEVLTGFTGSPFFPGGFSTHVVEPGGLVHESGPSETVTLQWATYYDAADEAGRSRLYGGIHVPADDLNGRQLGSTVGIAALVRAETLFS